MHAYGADLLAKAPGVDVAAAVRALPAVGVEPAHLDEFRFTGIETKADIRDRFVPRFFFGCEADDRAIAFAFSKANAFEARLQPIFSSDLAHWDVEDMNGVVDEAHGLVRKGLLTDADFADFTFHNPLRLFGQGNPGFFDGTVVQDAARAALAAPAGTPA